MADELTVERIAELPQWAQDYMRRAAIAMHQAWDRLELEEDEGPRGEGWQSRELANLVSELDELSNWIQNPATS